MELAARIGTMAANGTDPLDQLIENLRSYFSGSGTGTLDLTGIFDKPTTIINNGWPNSSQFFRNGHWEEIIIPNVIPAVSYCFSSNYLKVLRCYSLSLRCLIGCPNLKDVYLSGITASQIKDNVSWFPFEAPTTCTFHGNDGKKVIYDEATSAWVIVDDVSAGWGGDINA